MHTVASEVIPIDAGTTPAERRLYALLRKAFLEDFVYANPERGDGDRRELADCLVFFSGLVIVFSSKAIEQPKSIDDQGFSARLHSSLKKHVRKAAAQARGAERRLRSGSVRSLQNSRRGGVPFDPAALKAVHLVTVVSAEGLSWAPLFEEQNARVPVHVFTEHGLSVVLEELDTVGDFLAYLQDRHQLTSLDHVTVLGEEEDVLACWIMNGRSFRGLVDPGSDVLLDGGYWDEYSSDARKVRIEADRESYRVDALIDDLHTWEPRDQYLPIAAALNSLGRVQRRSLSRLLIAKVTQGRERRIGTYVQFVDIDTAVAIIVTNDPRAKRRSDVEAFATLTKAKTQSRTVVGIATNPTADEWDLYLLEGEIPLSAEVRARADAVFPAQKVMKELLYPETVNATSIDVTPIAKDSNPS